jgi:predicted nucleic acid-binding protein
VKNVYLDANVILRFLLGDHPELFAKSKAIFKMAERNEIRLLVEPVILAECCFVLRGKMYADRFSSKHLIADALTQVLYLSGVETENQVMLTEALEAYADHHVDFADAYLAVLARNQARSVATFDQDFRRLDEDILIPADVS